MNLKFFRKLTDRCESSNLVSFLKILSLILTLVAQPSLVVAETADWIKDRQKGIVQIAGYLPEQKSVDSETPFGEASGFLIDDHGIVLTSYAPFVERTGRLLCTRYEIAALDGSRLDAKIISVDSLLNLAILKIEQSTALLPVPVNPRNTAEPGDKVITLTGTGDTVEGVIKEKHRKTLYRSGLGDILINIQTDLPGHTMGSPMFDVSGELLAINTASLNPNLAAVVTDDEEHALPMSIIMTFYKVMMKYTSFDRPWIGFSFRNLNQDETRRLVRDRSTVKGLAVEHVWAEGLAGKIPMKAGDVLLEVNGRSFKNSIALDQYLIGLGIDVPVEIVYFSDGRINKASLITATRPRWAAP